jgi:hypothetical protein
VAEDLNDPSRIKQILANVHELQNIMQAGGLKAGEPVLLLHGSLYLQEIVMPDGSEWFSVTTLMKNCGKPDCPWCKNLMPSADRVTIDLRE